MINLLNRILLPDRLRQPRNTHEWIISAFGIDVPVALVPYINYKDCQWWTFNSKMIVSFTGSVLQIFGSFLVLSIYYYKIVFWISIKCLKLVSSPSMLWKFHYCLKNIVDILDWSGQTVGGGGEPPSPLQLKISLVTQDIYFPSCIMNLSILAHKLWTIHEHYHHSSTSQRVVCSSR